MAASLTVTRRNPSSGPYVERYLLTWVSAADGSVDIDTDRPIQGELARVVFVPDSGGTQPTNAYDMLLKDEHGVDVLGGQGANLANNANTHVCPGVPLKDGTTTSVRPVVVAGVLNLEITNAGDSKGGKVVLYVR